MSVPITSKFTFSAATESESIRGIAYSQASQTLSVEFHRGPTYVHMNVPKDVECSMLSAASVGSFYNTEIRGYYPYLKVGLADQAEITMKEASPAPTPTPVPLPSPTTTDEFPKPFSAKQVEPKRGPGRPRKQ